MKKTSILFMFLLLIGCSSDDDSGNPNDNNGDLNTTYVPDDNFEQALIVLGYDDLLDDYVLTSNISAITTLEINSLNISDLTGIEDFSSLTFLSCSNNNLTSLDVSNNNELLILQFINTQIEYIDVTQNTSLITLNCNTNQLTSIDVSKNQALEHLYVFYNQLISLDVSNNPALSWLLCNNNQLTSLNIANGNNSNIFQMTAGSNNLTCIQIDEGFTPPPCSSSIEIPSWCKDPLAEYSSECN